MSLNFGTVRQIGFVVRDVDEAMGYWTSIMGVGPFFVFRDVGFTDFFYRGQSAPTPVCSFGVAQWGDMQLELIQQLNDAPSAYREFLSAGRTGVQHFSTWFDDRGAYDAAREKGLAQGMGLVHESRSEKGRFCYFETGTPDVPLVELAEALLPASRKLGERVAAAAQDWDGSDPIRSWGKGAASEKAIGELRAGEVPVQA